MTWVPPIIIWAAFLVVLVYYIREWWRIGRDPKGATVIPRFGPPEGMSPMALFFIHRRATAEDVAINAGALGMLGELMRRKLVAFEERDDGPKIVEQDGGDETEMPPDLQRFRKNLLPRRGVADVNWFRKAAQQAWIDVHGMLAKRIIRFNLGVTLTGAAILVAAALTTVFFTNFAMPAGPDGLVIVAGFMASLFVFGALALRRSRIKAQFYMAIGLGTAGLITLLVVAVFIVNGLDGPAGLERALTMAGLFLVLPLIAFFWGVMIALTPDGRRLYDEIEGFRRFIAVADAGRHAIDNAPDPTQDSLDRLVPYAVALHVEAGWVNALAASLPLKAWQKR
jgi:hypothetical protein